MPRGMGQGSLVALRRNADSGNGTPQASGRVGKRRGFSRYEAAQANTLHLSLIGEILGAGDHTQEDVSIAVRLQRGNV